MELRLERMNSYPNAISIKQPNRRVTVVDDPRGDGFFIQFKVATDNLSPRASHTALRNKVVVTELCLTEDGAKALFYALGERLEANKNKEV